MREESYGENEYGNSESKFVSLGRVSVEREIKKGVCREWL